MTDSPHQPTGKGSEGDKPAATPLESNKALQEVLALTQHSSFASAHSDKPASAAASPAAPAHSGDTAKADSPQRKVADDRTVGTAFTDGAKHNLLGMVTGAAGAMGAKSKSDAEIQNEIKHNLGTTNNGSWVTSLFHTGVNIATNLPGMAKGVYKEGGDAIHTMAHGTANQKAELAGGLTAFVGTMLVGGAGAAGKVGTEAKALKGVEAAAAETQTARVAMTEYGQGARTATGNALRQFEERNAAAAAEKAVAPKAVAQPAEAHVTAPAPGHSPAARAAADAPAPTLATRIAEPQPSMMTRFASHVSSPFKSLFGTSEGALTEGKSLASRIDGLTNRVLKPAESGAEARTGQLAVHPAQRFSPDVKMPEGIRPTSIQQPLRVEARTGALAEDAAAVRPAVRPTEGGTPVKAPESAAHVDAPHVRTEAPAPVARVEAPHVQGEAPARVEAPAPVARVEAPAPVARVEAPAPVARVEAPHVQGEVPAPVARAEGPVPMARAEAPAPVARVEAPHVQGEVPAPVARAEGRVPLSRAEAPAPAARVEAPHVQGEVPAPVARVEAPAPATRIEAPHVQGEVQAPVARTEAPAPLARAEAPAPAARIETVAPTELPQVAAKASTNVENISRLASESGTPLTVEARQSLQNIEQHLKTVSRSGDEALSLTARNSLADDMAALEHNMVTSGADAGMAVEINQLKASINELAPKAPLAPASAPQAVLTREASSGVQSLDSAIQQSGVKLAPEAERSLQSLNSRFATMGEKGGQALDAVGRREMAQELATVERSLVESGAGPEVMKNFNQVQKAVTDLGKASIEREQFGSLNQSMKALEQTTGDVSASLKNLDRELQNGPALSAADQKVAQSVSSNLESIEQQLASSKMATAPAQTGAEVRAAVRELENPEYSQLFANNPQAARALEELQSSTATMAGATSRVESAQIGVSGIRQAEVLERGAADLSTAARDYRASLPKGEAAQPTSRALESIENNLATLKTGASPESVMRRVNADIDALEAAGADRMAADLRQRISPIEDAGVALDRGRRLDNSIGTMTRESSALESETSRLSKSFSDQARTAPSTAASAMPVQTEIAEQLQLIGRQAKLVDAGESGIAAVSKIKDAYTRVEELTAGQTLTAEQSVALRQVRESITRIDQASVEASGLRRLETNTGRIAENSNQVQTLTARISRDVDLASPVSREAGLGDRVANINQAAQDVKLARTVDEQVTAANKLVTAVNEPELQAALSRTKGGARTLDELKSATAELHESVSYRVMERSKVAAEAEAENAARASRALEQRIQNDTALANTPRVQTAVSEYRQAAENFAKAPDKNIAAAQLDQKLAAVETQIRTVAPTSSVLQGEELAAVRRAQAGLAQAAADNELISRSLIDRRLPAVENGFDKIARTTSSTEARDLMRGVSDQIQAMRYLESRVGGGAEKLTEAQMQLTRAQNDLEVAAYRGNLVKMAASGDKIATDKLLVSGLTTDSFKASQMLTSTSPTIRLLEDFAKNRLGLIGRDHTTFSVRSLAASDPVFVNNPGWLSANAVRNVGYTLMGVGGVSFGVGAYRDAQDKKAAAAIDSTSTSTSTSISTQTNVSGAPEQNNQVTAPEAQTESRVFGRSGTEANAFSTNGQTLARNAFTQDLNTQALPRQASVTALDSTMPYTAQGVGNVYDARTAFAAQANLRPLSSDANTFMLYRDDPDLDRKLFNISISGTIFGLRKGADPVAPDEVRTPLNMAQSLAIRSNTIKSVDGGRLDKLATSMFAIPSAQLSSPMALGLGQRRDVLGVRTGRSVVGGTAGTTSSEASLRASHNLMAEADAGAEEGGANAGTKNLKNVERTEASGIDSNASHAVSSNAAQHNGDDDDDHGNSDPVSATNPGPSNNGGNGGSNAGAASPVVARRVPGSPAASAANTSTAANSPVAESTDAPKASTVGAPPRKRSKDALSA